MFSDQEKIVVLYQGTCSFCNWCRELILRHSVPDKFEFIAIESEAGIRLIKEKQLMITVEHPNSIVVMNPTFAPKYKWQACMEIARQGDWQFQLLSTLLLVVPTWLGNRMYDWSGRNRALLCKLVNCSN